MDLQQSGLHAVTQTLPTLDAEHTELAAALDTTRHQIAARDVYIPEDEEQYYSEYFGILTATGAVLARLQDIPSQVPTHRTHHTRALVIVEAAW